MIPKIKCDIDDCIHNKDGVCGEPESIWIVDQISCIGVSCAYSEDELDYLYIRR